MKRWLMALIVPMAGWLHAQTPADATAIRLISAPALSADGKQVVFEWIDDLWLASSEGGEAKRLTHDPGREVFPRLTPDGKHVVFSSDRSGSLQVYSMPLSGGEWTRHTWHTEGNELECLSADGKRAIVRGVRERSGFLATRLMEIDLTADRREQRLFDATAHSASLSPDGKCVLFCRGGEQLYRKGFKGSRASQIWVFDRESRTFESLVADSTESRSPLWMPDGKGFYYISNSSGTANLWQKTSTSNQPVQITRFEDDGAVTPDLSADGSTLVFRRGTDVFRLRPSSNPTPEPLVFWTREPLPDGSSFISRIDRTSNADFTKDLKQVVFTAAGDIWWSDGTAACIQLTKTPAAETEVVFSQDGTWLYFLRDDGLETGCFRARLENGNPTNESRICGSTRSMSRLKLSPDGGAIAWVEGKGELYTAKPDGSSAKQVFKTWDMPTFDWSPDSKWLAIAAEDAQSNRDILLVPSDGVGETINLTQHPAFEGSPKWSPDGRWLVFLAKRDGSGKSGLWRIDLGKGGVKPGMKIPAAEEISTKGIDPVRVLWAPDSSHLRFQSSSATSEKLYSIGIDGKDMKVIASKRGVPIRITPEGALLWMVKGTPEVLTESITQRFPISLESKRPRQEVLKLGFRRIWRTLGERYYDPGMNGRDWNAMRLKYEALAAGARDSRQFDRVISYLRGELNASHLAFHRKPWPGEDRQVPSEQKTAHPGLVFDDSGPSDGPLRIARVISGSPVAMLTPPPTVGDVVVRIAGEAVSNSTPLHRFFNGAEKRPLPVVLRNAAGSERVIELRCISYQKARALDQQAREEFARNQVDAHHPDIAYLSVPNMNRDTLEKLKISVYQASLKSKAVILDFRNNIGGREADRMLNLFCQPSHSFTIPRDGPKGYPVDRRTAPAWNGSMVLLCNQNTFSNSEIFCHAIKSTSRAPLVGKATAGGVISAVNTSIPDVGVLQIPFRGWYREKDGLNYDLGGAVPDYDIDLTPADENSEQDPQLQKALEILDPKL